MHPVAPFPGGIVVAGSAAVGGFWESIAIGRSSTTRSKKRKWWVDIRSPDASLETG
jgi:hypothetical protein